jgi:hypothetical protein
MRSCSLPRALTTTIGVPMPSDADVRPLVAEPRDPGLAVPDPQRVEPRVGEVARHGLGDELVVLDYQDLRHCARILYVRVERRGGGLVNGS